MFPTLLLFAGSLIALIVGIIIGRAKTGRYDSPLLQKESCVGYVFLSLGLAIATVYRFLQFNRLYELEHNRRLGLDYFGIDFDYPLPLIYGVLAFVVACYGVWSRRKRQFTGWEKKRRLFLEVVVPTLLVGVVTFGCFVWPTPWKYWTLPPPSGMVGEGILDGPLEYQGHPVTHFRQNRFTGKAEARMGNKWETTRWM